MLTTFFVDGPGGAGGVGSDANAGTSLATPFASVQRAANVAQPGDTVLVRGGEYYEEVTLPRSGTASNPITFAAYNDEDVVLSAGEVITTPWTNEGGGIYSTPLAASELAAIGGRTGLTLFIDGVVGEEAHARDPSDLLDVNQYYRADNANVTNIDDGGLAAFPDNHWNDAIVVAQTSDFTQEYRRIQDFDKINGGTLGRIIVDTPFQRDPRVGDHFLIWDSLNALNSDGEWYYADGDQSGDPVSDRLYLRAPGGVNPSSFQIDVKRRDNVFEMAGRDYIHIHDFTLRGGDIDMQGSDHTLLQNIKFYATDRNFGPPDESNSVRGLILTGSNNVIRDSDFSHIYSLMIRLNGQRNQLINNRFDTGFGAGGPGAISLNGREHLISHNTFNRMGRSAIGGIAAPETIIQYNDFSNVALVTFDVGAIYLINSSQGNTEIRYNTFLDIDTKLSTGLYLDNQVTDVVAHHNVFYNLNAFGGKINLPTSFALYFNNTIFNSGYVDAFSATADRNAYGSKFFNNIYSSLDTSDFFASGDPLELAGNVQTASSGNFANAALGNFALQSGSAAIDAGIEIPGITEGFAGSAPDAGAVEFGEPMFATGHNFANPPNPVYDYQRIIFTNLLDNPSFESGFSGWDLNGAAIHNANTFNYKDSALGRFGTRSARISDGQRVSRTVTGLQPNTTYTVGAWGKLAKVIEAEDASVITNVSPSATSTYRGEGDISVGQLANGNYLGFPNVDFDAFNQLQIMMALTGSGDSVTVRRGSPTGTVIGSANVPANKIIWDPPIEIDLGSQSGPGDLYLVFSGSGDIGLIDEIRLLDTTQTDAIRFEASDYGGDSTTSLLLDSLEYPNATPTLQFRTGFSSTSATISFEMTAGAAVDGFIDFVSLTETDATANPDSALRLMVDYVSGDTLLVNPTENPITIDGYSIRSANSLFPLNWTSFEDSGLDNNEWFEANATTSILSELNPTDSTTLAPGQVINLGSLFNPTQPEDLTLEYLESDSAGAAVVGDVSYGTLSPIALSVDTTSGEVVLRNYTGTGVSFDGYTVSSSSDALQPANWLSLDDQGIESDTWQELTATATALGELNATTSTLLPVGGTLSLGNLFDTASAKDLSFEFFIAEELLPTTGLVFYAAGGFNSADFNTDSSVDGLDLTIWQASYGQNNGGDADNDNDSDGFDFLTWQTNFNPANQVSAFSVSEELTQTSILAVEPQQATKQNADESTIPLAPVELAPQEIRERAVQELFGESLPFSRVRQSELSTSTRTTAPALVSMVPEHQAKFHHRANVSEDSSDNWSDLVESLFDTYELSKSLEADLENVS